MKTFADHFDEIYLDYFARLYRFAIEYVEDEAEAKNLVQDVFLSIWERRDTLEIRGSISTYLYTLVKNRCIDHLRHLVAVKRHEKELALEALEVLDTYFEENEDIENRLTAAIKKLPSRCREIFLLSRAQNKKYREIADILHISPNTVENQMAIALKKLRELLVENKSDSF